MTARAALPSPFRPLVNEDGSIPLGVTLCGGCRVTVIPDGGQHPYVATVALFGDEGPEVRVQPGGHVNPATERRVPRAWLRDGWLDTEMLTMPTYELVEGGTAIRCTLCNRTSHNPNDVAQRYCGNCHRFHDDPPAGEARS